MNEIIRGRSTPGIRYIIKGILLCEMLNEHLRWKIQKYKERKLDILYEIEMVSSDESDDELKNLLVNK